MARSKSLFIKGVGYLIAASFIYGFFGLMSRTVGLTIPIFYQNATRNCTAAIILTVIVSSQKAWRRIAPRDFWIMLVRAIAGSLAFLTFFYTIIKIPFGPSYFLFYAGSVLFGYILGHFWFQEHLTKIKILSLIFAILGLSLVYQVNISVISPIYFGLAIFSGTTTAIWDVISKKISKGYSASLISFWDEALSAIMYFSVSFFVGEQWGIPAMTIPWIASLGIGVCFVVTGMLIINGFRLVEAQIGSIILLAEIPFALLLGWIFYRESISLLTIIGGTLIIAAIALPEIYTKSK